MKIIPGQSTGPTLQTTASPAQQSARERAISALMGTAPQVNQNSIKAEEMGSIKAPETLQDAPESTIPEGHGASTEEPVQASPEAPSEVPAEPAKVVEDPLSKQYAILARKEKQLRSQIAQQKAALQAEREALEKQKAEFNRPAFDESKYIQRDRLLQDPISALNEMGLGYEELTNRILNSTKADPQVVAEFNKIKEELKSIKNAQEESRKSWQEQQQQQYKQAVAQIRSEATSLVNESPDFETIKETGSVDDVVELIEKEFKSSGRLMTVDEAARAVEEYLVEEATKIARLKKIQQRLNPPAQGGSKQAASAPQTAAPQKQPLKTLTNAVGSTRPLSAKERAVLAFKGELKN